MMQIDPATIPPREMYKLLIGAVVPRPIAWVMSLSATGVPNLAPFSYFTIASSDPPILLFCPQPRPDGSPKDTLRNVRETGAFTIHIVSEALVAPMNQTSASLPPGMSEVEWAGLATIPGTQIAVPRLADAPVAFECRVEQIVAAAADAGAAVVFGRVLCCHLRDDVYNDGYVRLDALQPVARLAGNDYARISDTFSLARPHYDPARAES
jgi:flavin reductase (DIM6/NTAB) family NADH-FMN oxidoreductase RutF